MRKLSVLVIHNRYRQPGGEDLVVEEETRLLRQNGHRVITFMRDNREIEHWSLARRAQLFAGASWNQAVHRQLRRLIRRERPDVAHCHNLLPLISPAAYRACQAEGVPVVQTLHNYRLLCPAGNMFRHGQHCGKCSQNPWPAICHGCYRDSRAQSAAVALMIAVHRHARTWTDSISTYIALTCAARDQFTAAGLPLPKFRVKPNFVAVPPTQPQRAGGYAVFAGRLTPEKGVLEMLEAWQHIPDIPLVVLGDGPLRMEVVSHIAKAGRLVRFLGRLSHDQAMPWIADARLLIYPSRWDEPFGMTLIEAAAAGVPAIAARIGGIPEIVSDQETGLLFDPEDPQDLVQKVRWAWTHPDAMTAMGEQARLRAQNDFSPAHNYEMLMEIYGSVVVN